MVGNFQNVRVGDGAQQVAHETIEFGIGDQVSSLLVAQCSTQDAREAEQRRVAAGEAIRTAVGADQFALDTKRGGLQRNEMYVLESSAVNGLAKTHCVSSPKLAQPKVNMDSTGKK